MGFDCELQELFSFIYHVKLSDDLFEHELDRVFVGRYDGQPTPNPTEVDDWKWMNIGMLKQDIQENPQNYTYWFKLVLDRVIKRYQKVGTQDEA